MLIGSSTDLYTCVTIPERLRVLFPVCMYLKVDVCRVLCEHPHYVSEALVDGDVERCTHGVVQQVDTGPFAQEEACDFGLVPAHTTQTHAIETRSVNAKMS